MIALSLIVLGCSEPGEVTVDEPTAEPQDTACFWCTDDLAGADGSSDDTAVSSDDTAGSGDDTGISSGADSYDAFKIDATWVATISLDQGTGEIEYIQSGSAPRTSCTLVGPLTVVAAISGCDDCDFAMEMRHGDLEITSDDGGCDAADALYALSGAALAFGQGTKSYGEYGGVEYFDLQNRGLGDWSAMLDGYSAVYSDGGADYWFFGGGK